jgi:hydroxylamine reductase
MPASSLEGLLAQGQQTLLPARFLTEGKEVSNLKELVLYGLKGVAAYAAHALALGAGDAASFGKIHELLDFLTKPAPTADEFLASGLAVGELDYRVMEILDKAHTETFGHPVPSKVRLHARKGNAILVSGHDLHDLYALLEQTQGLGIQIYTHGEMLPAHGYPKLKAYEHLAGNYGGAWTDQADEFAEFPGAILMTSKCIQEPKLKNRDRIFTSGTVAWPGVLHIADQDFAPVIAAALQAPGYDQDGSNEEITVGFGHNAVLSVAGRVIDAVKAGAIRHFFLIGGCDGARSGRSYYTELAESIPADCLILTLACGKFSLQQTRFRRDWRPAAPARHRPMQRYLFRVANRSCACQTFGCGVNDFPLCLVLSWYEQKAVAVLLTLLYLGVRNIRIGPTLPAFLSPGVLTLLHEKFNLMAIGTAEEDLAAMLL